MSNQIQEMPVIVTDEVILQRANRQGESVGRRQVITYQGHKTEVLHWFHASGKLSRVTSRSL